MLRHIYILPALFRWTEEDLWQFKVILGATNVSKRPAKQYTHARACVKIAFVGPWL